MFAFALRAIILIGVLGWYSTGVWKMIDSYFKDRFEKYLREEYIKNPRIKTDLDSYRTKKNKVDGTIERTPHLNKNGDNENTIVHGNKNKSQLPVGVDFLDTIEVNIENKFEAKNQTNFTNFPSQEYSDIRSSETHKTIEISANVANQKQPQSPPTTKNKPTGQSSTINSLKKKKKKIKIITFTKEDFQMAKLSASADYDFSEFDYDEDNGESARQVPGGINVANLPFKPRADLGNLDVVTEDEYCPFNIDDHGENCKATREWP